ncbi:MAG: class I SAM-dependent methyltransferase [Pseudomonadales bacterium]|nr:class I SAM-dependent methyltransferase [Pseudomonadales bacterium]NRA14698.1 class I SAM-dependent methyltransferase [Oceanospirillaceae bacterium]
MRFLSRKFSFSKSYPNDLVSRYDRVAANWHVSLQANHHISGYQQVIDEAINCFQFDLVSAFLSVLDAGAGTAGFSLALGKRLHRELTFDLLDPSPTMLNIAQQQLHNRGYSCKLIHGVINVLQHSRKRYDLILCDHVIEHCADGHAALQTLFRVMSDNGIIILAVSKPHWCTRLIQLTWGHQAKANASFIMMLHSARFSRVFATCFKKGPTKLTSYGYFANNS